VDVTTTVLGALGLQPPGGLDGVDLRSLLDEDATIERPLFFETSRNLRGSELAGVRRGRHKLVVDGQTGQRDLYDLDRDPKETLDVSAEHPEIVERLAEGLDWIQTQRRDAEVKILSDEEKKRLRALGYL